MAGKRPKGSPEPLGTLLKERLTGTPLGERLHDLEVWRQWDAVVGPAIARRARPLRLSSGVLTVVVSSAPWMQQLSFMKAELRDRLNRCLGEERIRELVLKAGRVAEVAAADEEERQPTPVPLTPLRQSWIDEQARTMADDELRSAFRDLMTCHYRRNGS